jgi:1-deoxy-D-xylulose-5-phosphate synthase
LSQTAHRLEVSVKGFLTAGGLFQELGFNYIGPVDGHDLPVLIGLLSNIKEMRGPILLHCATTKGKGFSDAEKNPVKYHGVSPHRHVEIEGEALPPEKVPPSHIDTTFTDVFAETLIEAAEKDKRIAAITAAMPSGTGLNKFQDRFPDRFFDVGICEQHAVTFAAGLAAEGARPVFAIYSTFLQRGFDQVIHDVCLQNLPVVFAVDRAGLVGEDSPTHSGSFDLSFLRAVPNLEIYAPRDDVDLRQALIYALGRPGPVAIRYPRDIAVTIGRPDRPEITRGEILRKGTHGTFLSAGPCAANCLKAATLLSTWGYSIGVADARAVKPLDKLLIEQLLPMPIITVEENALAGGFGAAVLEYCERTGRMASAHIKRLGLNDEFPEHASRKEQITDLSLDAESIATAARAFLAKHVTPARKIAEA